MAFELMQVAESIIVFVLIVGLLVGGYLAITGLGNASSDASVTAAVNNGTAALDNISTNTPTMATIIAVSAVIGLLLLGFGGLMMNRGGFR